MANGAIEEIDCRPSDALAMEAGAPIFVAAELLSQEGYDSATSFHTDSQAALHPFEFKAAA